MATDQLTVKQNGIAEVRKLPTLAELVQEDEGTIKQNQLMVLLNQPPPQSWVKEHPIAKIKKNGVEVPVQYLPVSRVEYLLSRIYGKWWVEIKSVINIANSCVVTVRLYVTNPITHEVEWNEGVGACPIQTDKGAGAMDWNKAKASGVQMAAPAAAAYAMKSAAENFGKIFGKDLGRVDEISYNDLLKQTRVVSFEDVRELYELKKDSLSEQDIKDAERILNDKEEKSYFKLQQKLMSL